MFIWLTFILRAVLRESFSTAETLEKRLENAIRIAEKSEKSENPTE